MSSAVETLGSQHNGAGNYKEVGYLLQRSCLVLTAIAIPMMPLWYFAYDLFLALGVERVVCEVIMKYLRVLALKIPCDIVIESYEKV